jgi:hypothetical protein
MGSADYYADGDWNFFCDLCGKKAKASTGVKTWDGHYVCRSHKEVRNPQDFIRGVRENLSVPWERPEAPDVFVGIPYTRFFAEPVPALETVAKAFATQFGSTLPDSSAINGHALNTGALNYSSVAVANPEQLLFSEQLSLQPAMVQAESVSIAETVTVSLLSNLALNGSALNQFALG